MLETHFHEKRWMDFLICFRQKSQQFLEHWNGWVLTESLEDTKDRRWYSQKVFSQSKIELPTLQELRSINLRVEWEFFCLLGARTIENLDRHNVPSVDCRVRVIIGTTCQLSLQVYVLWMNNLWNGKEIRQGEWSMTRSEPSGRLKFHRELL